MELGRLGAGLARTPAHDTARGALRHGAGPCDTAEGHGHDTMGWRWGAGHRREWACRRERARKRVAGARGTARRGSRVSAATRQPGAATRPALATTRPGQGPRYGHCAHTWACLGDQLGQLDAYAPDSVFSTWFSTQYCF